MVNFTPVILFDASGPDIRCFYDAPSVKSSLKFLRNNEHAWYKAVQA